MKKISFILFLIVISSLGLYSQGHHMGKGSGGRGGSGGCNKCNKMLNQFEIKGIEFTDSQKVLIMTQYKKTHETRDVLNIEKREIERTIASELVKTNPNKATIKSLIMDKNIIEAEIEYTLVEFDLYILSFLSKEQIVLLNQQHHRLRNKQ